MHLAARRRGVLRNRHPKNGKTRPRKRRRRPEGEPAAATGAPGDVPGEVVGLPAVVPERAEIERLAAAGGHDTGVMR